MTRADQVVQALKAYGVPFVATLSGNGTDPLYVACARNGVRLVDFRNEQAAAYAADAYARLSGRLGVVLVSSGVAHVNALTGLLNAYFDGAPVLLITGASDHARADAGRFQDMDQVALAAPICKYAKNVDRADRVLFYVQEAISRALSGRPGPTHLTIPADVLSAEAGPAELPRVGAAAGIAQPKAAGDPALIAEAAKLLGKSQRPVLVQGSGAFYAKAGEALDGLASKMQIPVVVPIWDRGVVERPAPYFLGVVGAASGGPTLLPDADAVIIAGSQVDYRVGYAEPPTIKADARIIRIDVDPETLRQGVEPDVAIQGDPKSVLSALANELERQGGQPYTEWLEETRRRDRQFRSRWDAVPAAPPMIGHHIVEALRPLVQDDKTLFLVDGGNIGQWAHMVLGNRYPSNWLTCGASAVVGWGMPGAIGVKLANPDRPVVLLSGDGAFGFTVAELETAVRQSTPFVVVIADDRAWGIVVSSQIRAFGPEWVLASRVGSVRYDLVAEGFGALGLRAEKPEEILPAVQEGLASGRPTVVQVPIAVQGPSF